ncbi:MAG TPA: hypothetical protein VG488_07545 [Candidatus Angelobacter sp.]|nr:hypothetical protein [Candidatus Angelobacter sp.]
MFFAVNRIGTSDGQRIVSYQLFQIAKRLKSNELTVLKAVHELNKKGQTQLSSGGYKEWAQKISLYLGHSLIGLIDRADAILIENCLLSPRVQNSNYIDITNLRLTDLGIEFCQNIERYQIEKS